MAGGRALAQSGTRDPRPGTGGGAPAIELVGLRKAYGRTLAVAGVDLTIGQGEFFTLLGPSGSGKTTLLRVIGGFERPDAGRVLLGGADATARPPYDRPVNTVFQDYALFPHMSVADNVGYGLAVRRVPGAERRRRVEQALELVRLAGMGKRRPGQLSGGQRQRVALARALVNEPQVLLLDEPLGALDLKLRQEMQVFLKRMQRELAITFLYVTHDQEEALTMSDRVAVLRDGRLQQVGSPVDVYEEPVNEFVAGFIGVSNVLRRDDGLVTVRPEKIRLLRDDRSVDGWHVEPGTVRDVVYAGMTTRYVVDLDDGGELIVAHQNSETVDVTTYAEPSDRRVRLAWRPEHAYRIRPAEPAADDLGAPT